MVSGLLLASLTMFAQMSDFRFDIPADLKQYLNLTDAEVAFILQANSDYNQTVSTQQQRIAQLQSEIAAETQKDPLDPMALGVRYAEIETIRPDLANQKKSLRDNLRASLDDSQRTKLNALTDANNLEPIIDDAQCENLLDQQSLFGREFVSFGPLCSLPGFPPQLLQYLALSIDQADMITSLNSDNLQQTFDRLEDISQLQAQIIQETAKAALDPLAIGTLYAQIETVRREIDNDLATLRKNVRATLTDAQQVKLTTLDDARKLQPLISEATCENLVDGVSLFDRFLVTIVGYTTPCAIPTAVLTPPTP